MPKDSKVKRKDETTQELEREVEVDYHTVELNALVSRLGTSIKTGLTSEHAETILKQDGPNCLTPPKKTPEIIKFLKEFLGGFSLLLEVGAILCFIAAIVQRIQDPSGPLDNAYLGAVLVVVVITTGCFSYYQNSKSSKIMDSFKKLVPQESTIMRDGKKMNIRAEGVVAGDIVYLRGGDLIPADIRVIEASSFKVDNSSLTGESEPQKRVPECTNQNLLETANMAFAYTYAVEGSATGIAVATGDRTVMGKIATLTSGLKANKTPIGIEIEKFIKLITAIAVVIGVVFFVLALVRGTDFITSVVFLIGIIVANVPEGLLVTVTLALTLTAKKMAEKNCLIKNLESVETLGSTSVICSDKTGTLTQNRMTVSHLWFDLKTVDVDTKETLERTSESIKSLAYESLVKIAALCNRAEFRENQDMSIPVLRLITNGDASESALIKYVELFAGPLNKIREQHKKLFEIPFNSVNKYQLSIHEHPASPQLLVLMKGAPERVIDRCTRIMIDDNILPITDEYKNAFNQAYETMGGMGERVLGFCMNYLPASEFPHGTEFCDSNDKPLFDMENFIFVGLMSMIDPPRATVPRAVELCRSAGIKVIMVTGDHPITARAIARNVGIITGNAETYQEMQERIRKIGGGFIDYDPHIPAAIITGNDLRDMTQDQLDQVILLHPEIVFARTSPQQKLTIVEGFQRQGAIVAVTGDGVNDSPALRKADIGIAMGIAGSDVAKQVRSSFQLLSLICNPLLGGVEQGRLIFDNLKKSIAYTLTSNIPEIAPFLVYNITGTPLALGTVTILCIDLGTDLIPAISLAHERAEMDIMKRKPRDPRTESLVNVVLIDYSYLLVGVIQALAGFLSYVYIMLDNGFEWHQLAVGEAWTSRTHTFVIDSFGQEWSYKARTDLVFTCQTAFFFSIVIMQWSDLLISKTRMMSIFQQGLFRNKMLIIGILCETILALLITYVPWLNLALQTRIVNPKYLIPAFIYSAALLIIDELRRLHIRRAPKGFIFRETYY